MSRKLLVVVVVFAVALAGCAQLMADSLEALLKQGLELLAAQRYDEAAAKFLEVVRRDPKSWDGYVGLTRAYLGKGSWADAIASGRKALALAPDRSEVTAALADALFGAGTEAVQQRRFSDAAGHLVEYVKLRPADVQGYLQLGRAYWQSGQLGNAFTAFQRVLELNPTNTEALQFLRGTR